MPDEPPKADKPELRIGSYRLIEQLGSGGMSSVFRAFHDESGHEVAVKVLPRSLAKNPTLLQRFLREAKAAEALEHPNIVSIYDRGVDQGRHYLVLEYVPGGDLHDRVRGGGPLEIPEAVRVIQEVASGLDYALSLGLIHRDIKPANILVSPSGQVKIIDLGLALQAESEDERVTRDGTTVGTVDYMSPEQARDSRATSEKSDIYSLGCTLYFLLTGTAPFAGGDLADKLARHCTQPAPDSRKLRPDVPDRLAAVNRRMMAKRPENRFESYDSLIAALRSAMTDAAAPQAQEEVLDALIDDEDDDLTLRPAPPALNALIADDSEPELPVAKPTRLAPSREKEASTVDVFSMAELAALDDDAPAAKASRPVRASAPRPAEPALSALLDDGEDEHVAALPGAAGRSSFQFSDASAQTLIKRSISIGVAIVLLVIGADQLFKASKSPSVDQRRPDVDTSSGNPVAPDAGVIRTGQTRPRPTTTVVKSIERSKTADAPKPPPPWVEPTDLVTATAPEVKFGPEVESRFVPTWASQPIPDRIGTIIVPVRRLASGAEKPNVRLGVEVIGSAVTVELADDGPFCEDDLRIAGEARLIRAQGSFRPIIKIEAPKLPVVREQPAVIMLEGKQLTLDGLDLVVNVDELPRTQSALFECAGASLTMRNCTVTVLNPKSAPFSIVRTVAAGRPSRIRLDRCYIRGPWFTALDFGGGTVEASLSQSVLLTGGAALISENGKDGANERRVYLTRSVLAGRAPVVELNPPPPGTRPKALALRALATTFACVTGANPPSLIVARGGAGGAAERVQWQGDYNVFAGWNALFSGGSDGTTSVADLPAARRVWSGTDPSSQAYRTPWPEPPNFDRVVLEQLYPLAPERLATLTRITDPSGYLHEKTFFTFERPLAPNLAAAILAPKPAPVVALPKPMLPPAALAPQQSVPKAPVTGPKAIPKGPRPPDPKVPRGPRPPDPKTMPVPGAPAPDQPLVFDPTAAPWHGDLGLYLREHFVSAGKTLRVYVKGRGDYPFTPVVLPTGKSLEILGEPEHAPADVPTWFPTPAASASHEALIEVRNADLIVSGVNFTREPSPHPKVLFKVDHGHLVVYRCRLLSPGIADAGGGGLIAFRAASTQPLAARDGPFTAAADRPICRLVDCTMITGGDAIAAELGRGRVALTNCALAAGRSAFVLTPAKVARARFEADLTLDHCTVAAEHNVVRLDPWKGTAPGPARPWLVASQYSAFVASYATATREHVLLRSLGGSVASGTLFWQGNTDAFEFPHFTALDDRPPAPTSRPDLRRQWIEIWGANHFRNVIGPGTAKPGSPSGVRLAEKLKPGEVAPRDLILEARDRRATDIGADANRLRLSVPTHQTGRRN